jgi:hypothetical protein
VPMMPSRRPPDLGSARQSSRESITITRRAFIGSSRLLYLHPVNVSTKSSCQSQSHLTTPPHSNFSKPRIISMSTQDTGHSTTPPPPFPQLCASKSLLHFQTSKHSARKTWAGKSQLPYTLSRVFYQESVQTRTTMLRRRA